MPLCSSVQQWEGSEMPLGLKWEIVLEIFLEMVLEMAPEMLLELEM